VKVEQGGRGTRQLIHAAFNRRPYGAYGTGVEIPAASGEFHVDDEGSMLSSAPIISIT
jgi:hypothetical protein